MMASLWALRSYQEAATHSRHRLPAPSVFAYAGTSISRYHKYAAADESNKRNERNKRK